MIGHAPPELYSAVIVLLGPGRPSWRDRLARWIAGAIGASVEKRIVAVTSAYIERDLTNPGDIFFPTVSEDFGTVTHMRVTFVDDGVTRELEVPTEKHPEPCDDGMRIPKGALPEGRVGLLIRGVVTLRATGRMRL